MENNNQTCLTCGHSTKTACDSSELCGAGHSGWIPINPAPAKLLGETEEKMRRYLSSELGIDKDTTPIPEMVRDLSLIISAARLQRWSETDEELVLEALKPSLPMERYEYYKTDYESLRIDYCECFVVLNKARSEIAKALKEK